MLPFDILAADDNVYSFEPACLLTRSKRFSKENPQNDWEAALVHVQEHDAPQFLPTVCGIPAHTIILRYCAAHVLLAKRAQLLNASRVEDWYMLLDARTAFDNFDSPDFYPHTLGRLRTLYGVEWLHARATQYTPLQHAWFAGHYWPTLWSAATPSTAANKKAHGHNIERWSFLGNEWHIQHWTCEREDDAPFNPYSYYTSRVASPLSIQNAFGRTLLLSDDACIQAWDSIPLHLRVTNLLDWTLAEPAQDHRVLPYLCERLGAGIHDLSTRLDLARTLQSSGATILQSLANSNELWALPQD